MTPILQLARSASEDERTFCVVCVSQKSENWDSVHREDSKNYIKNKDVPVVHVLESGDDKVEYDDERHEKSYTNR